MNQLVGSNTEAVGPCKGDSGGPLVDVIANEDGSISKEYFDHE